MFCQQFSQWCLRHRKISLHLEEAKQLPQREHCVGNVGRYRSAWKDGKWVTVLVGATVGLGEGCAEMGYKGQGQRDCQALNCVSLCYKIS